MGLMIILTGIKVNLFKFCLPTFSILTAAEHLFFPSAKLLEFDKSDGKSTFIRFDSLRFVQSR